MDNIRKASSMSTIGSYKENTGTERMSTIASGRNSIPRSELPIVSDADATTVTKQGFPDIDTLQTVVKTEFPILDSKTPVGKANYTGSVGSQRSKLLQEFNQEDSIVSIGSSHKSKLNKSTGSVNSQRHIPVGPTPIHQTEFPRLENANSTHSLRAKKLGGLVQAEMLQVDNSGFPSVESLFDGVVKNLEVDEKLWELINKLCTP